MSNQENLTELNNCVCCGGNNLKLVLDLGNQPLANSYKNSKDELQEEYPLAINRCLDCSHVQLTHAVNPELMFRDYAYVSGTSNTMLKHFDWFAKYALETYGSVVSHFRPESVLDIGCNDGSQLDAFKNNGSIETFGVDPAENLYERSSKSHEVTVGFFDHEFVNNQWRTFDIITAQNVFAHTSDPLSFLNCAWNSMNLNSLLFIQTSQADMIKNCEFDTIYHEHISFFNVNSMNTLCKRANLFLIDAIKCPLHGNSYIFVIAKRESYARPNNIQNLIDMESFLQKDNTYEDYASECKSMKIDFGEVINDQKFDWDGTRKTVIGYGAAAKAMTLLNYTGIKLDLIIDDNPLKQGKYTPGSSIPIVSSDVLDTLSSDGRGVVFIPLAWNFFDEIRGRIKSKRSNDMDIFIKLFPKTEVSY